MHDRGCVRCRLKPDGGVAPPKEILRTNTRFAGNFLDSQAARVLAAAGVTAASLPTAPVAPETNPQPAAERSALATYGGGTVAVAGACP